MYSAFLKYACLVGSLVIFTALGAAIANHGFKQGFVITFLLGLGCMHFYSVQCRAQGAKPVTRLPIGHSCLVEAVLPDIQTDRGPATYRLVVSWHPETRSYVSRLAYLNAESFRLRPEVGQRILVLAGDYGEPRYILHHE